MKVLLKLSLAALLVTTSLALSLQEFVDNAKVQALAPHLIQEIDTQGIESFTPPAVDIASTLISGIKLPLLNDLIQIISLNIFHAQDADWSKLENARQQIIRDHGAEAFTEAVKLTETDTRRAALVLNTIYDTVINLPAASKENLVSKKKEETPVTPEGAKDPSANSDTKLDGKPEEKKMEESTDKEKEDSSSAPSLLNTAWEYFGLGLMKSSDTVKKAQGIVSPRSVCETTDAAYLKGVDNVVYYSSLTHGIAGGALISAPPDSAVKSLDLASIVTAIGKLAIEVQMAQSVARLADLKLTDPAVRTVTFLALAAETAESPSAQTARDINNLINKGMSDLIPEAVLHSLSDQAALTLVTRGAGKSGGGSSVFLGVPILRNVVAFSSDVLNANNVGDVLKYVFCPGASHATEPPKGEVVVEDIKKTAEDISEKGKETSQKVLKVPEGAAKKVSEETVKIAEDTKIATEKVVQEGKKVVEATQEKAREVVDATNDKVKEAGEKIQDKVTEGTEKVDAEGKKATEEAKAKLQEAIDALKKKVEEVAQEASEEANKVQDKVDDIKEEL